MSRTGEKSAGRTGNTRTDVQTRVTHTTHAHARAHARTNAGTDLEPILSPFSPSERHKRVNNAHKNNLFIRLPLRPCKTKGVVGAQSHKSYAGSSGLVSDIKKSI